MSPGVLDLLPAPDVDPSRLDCTSGGVDPVQQLRPGDVVRTWTRDCCAGRVGSTADLVSPVCHLRYLDPQTGPSYVEGAEPGDTLAVHLRSIQPRETRGFSSTVPFSGALTATDGTVMLHPTLPEHTWV